MMNRNFIYLINPISGTKNKESLLQLIEQKTGHQNINFQVLPTNAGGDYSSLVEKIRNEKITDVIVCGGDGTINQVAVSLLETDINIGIIPMGSGNGLALAAGIPPNASRALDIIFKGNSSYIDGFYINGKFSCMLCGIGFDALVAHEFAEHPSRGLATYIKLTLKHFFKAKPYPFEIELNDMLIKTEAFFISIANSNQFGNHFTIAPKASLSDGLLDIVIANKMSKPRLIFSILKQIRIGKVQFETGEKQGKHMIQYFQTRKLRLKNPAMAPLHIDGDPATTAPEFNISIAGKAIRLLQPQ